MRIVSTSKPKSSDARYSRFQSTDGQTYLLGKEEKPSVYIPTTSPSIVMFALRGAPWAPTGPEACEESKSRRYIRRQYSDLGIPISLRGG